MLKKVVVVMGMLLSLGMGEGPLVSAASSTHIMTNPGTLTIDHPEKFFQVFAISDVHGMYDPLVSLLQAAQVVDSSLHWSARNSLFIVIGDSIDKGPDSVDVLDLWIRLSIEAEKAGGQLVHLLGNHEATFLADPVNDRKSKELIKELRSKGIEPRELTDSAFPRGRFLRSLPVALNVGKWLFFHSGWFPKDIGWAEFQAKSADLMRSGSYENLFLSANDSVLEAKAWWASDVDRALLEQRLDANGFFGVVFGHQPKAFGAKGRIAAVDEGRLIKIDNGMAPQGGEHPGSLLVFSQPSELKVSGFPQTYSVGLDGKYVRIVPEQALNINLPEALDE